MATLCLDTKDIIFDPKVEAEIPDGYSGKPPDIITVKEEDYKKSGILVFILKDLAQYAKKNCKECFGRGWIGPFRGHHQKDVNSGGDRKMAAEIKFYNICDASACARSKLNKIHGDVHIIIKEN
jgi:hypothetical protein